MVPSGCNLSGAGIPPVDTFSYDDKEIRKYNKNIEAPNFLFMECIFNSRNITTGWEGRNGARCFFTPIGPMPGPPPPWGMQNVLWRFRWQTSAPIQPGLVRPTCKDQRFSQN